MSFVIIATGELSVPAPSYGPRCPIRHPPRIAEVVTRRLVEKSVGADRRGGGVVLQLPDGERRLSRREAAALRDELTAALAGRHEYLHTVGEHRPDGSYVVSRRGADSAGHSKRFRRFAEVEALYARLPETFTADDVGDAAESRLSGGRRHLVLRHLAEHPAFDCGLVTQQPLTGRKGANTRDDGFSRDEPEVTPVEC